jgi:endonuclease YncB( thermonuclease family)
VEDAAQRKALSRAADEEEWTTAQLDARVRESNLLAAANGSAEPGANGGSAEKPPELLKPRRGTPGLHPVVDRGEGPAVDLGFKLYRALGSVAKLAAGDIVRLTDDPSTPLRAGDVRRIDSATKTELFTYAATVRKVVDGDTFVVALAVAPGITLELKLRLRGLDCPETSTAEGRAAKRFVEEFVRAGDEVVLSTTKPDKYDRYLADLFVLRKGAGAAGSERADANAGAEIFLNNALLEERHAVRYDGVGPKEE